MWAKGVGAEGRGKSVLGNEGVVLVWTTMAS